MNAVVASLKEHLTHYDEYQRRFLRACLGRESDPVVPFAGHTTTVRPAPRGTPDVPADAVRVAYVAADGAEHLDAVLDRGDLMALGLGPWVFRFASEAALSDLLSALLPDSLERASRLLGGPVTLRVLRLHKPQELPARDWPSIFADAVPHLGRLRFRMSPALIAACEANSMPRRGPNGMRHIVLKWDVRIGCLALERRECEGLAKGDVLRVLLSPLRQADVVGGLVPHFERLPGTQRVPRCRKRVNVLIDPAGWINLKFGYETQGEYDMDEHDDLNGPIIPVNLTLPVAAMSLHEIDSVRPGTLVDTGVRMQDVEVALWTAGYRFATGRLVVIGEHLGVEIGRTERDLP